MCCYLHPNKKPPDWAVIQYVCKLLFYFATNLALNSLLNFRLLCFERLQRFFALCFTRFAVCNTLCNARAKIHDKLRDIKQSFVAADWDTLIMWAGSQMIRAELRKQEMQYLKSR